MTQKNTRNHTVIYWKWDDSIFEKNITESVDDLCSRFGTGAVFIAIHWIRKRLDDPELLNAIQECCQALHERDRKIYLEVCPRNEGTDFFEQFPQAIAYLAQMEEVSLDATGRGEFELSAEPVYHYWRVSGESGPEKVLGAWALEHSGNGLYEQGSLAKLVDRVQLMKDESSLKTKVKIDAGAEHAGKMAVVCLGTPQPLPDLASSHFSEYYSRLLKAIAHLPLDGLCSDEWGYDVILKIEEVNPYNDNNLFLRHLSVSESFSEEYALKFEGSNLWEDLIHLRYAPNGDETVRIAVINRYVSTLRSIMARNDSEMYRIAKAQFGSDLFYGVHPTWWGSVDSLNFEIFKNGFYWWEAKRDIAQTDELVIIPIRLALARKWGGPIWYNMWYSLGTRDILTYYKETWNNVRYGGRTHYLGYECPNEPVVLELYPTGLLEEVERMDARVRMLDGLQTYQPDSRVLVLFGFEAVTNWSLVGRPLPPWPPQNPKLDNVLNTANQLFSKTLCDLMPTSEIENASLAVKQGCAVYNGHQYDAVVLFYPESMNKRCYDTLRELDKSRFIVCGTPASMYSDGSPIGQEDADVLSDAAFVYEDLPSADELAQVLAAFGVKTNRFDNGCIYTDGSAVFTAEGLLPCGNPLEVDVILADTEIRFSGEDFLYVKPCSKDPEALYPNGGTLTLEKITMPIEQEL